MTNTNEKHSKVRLLALETNALVAMLLALADPSAAQQMTNEPQGFRGVIWASPFEQQRDAMLLLRREGDVAYFKKKGEGLNFGQIEAIKIAYRYYKDQFSAGVVQTYGGSNKKALIESLHSQHGASTKPYKRIEQYRWSGEQANIVLTCEVTSYCAAEFVSVAVSKIEAADTGAEPPPSLQKRDDDGDDD